LQRVRCGRFVISYQHGIFIFIMQQLIKEVIFAHVISYECMTFGLFTSYILTQMDMLIVDLSLGLFGSDHIIEKRRS
jgi:hypothetical protein